ncbi:MAG: hypothetical protein IJM44_05225 [Ruminococcus sp.]|nr:hypothetical protein [Ruminococcus sp.]
MLYYGDICAAMAAPAKTLTIVLMIVLFIAAAVISAFVTYKVKSRGRGSSSDEHSKDDKD